MIAEEISRLNEAQQWSNPSTAAMFKVLKADDYMTNALLKSKIEDGDKLKRLVGMCVKQGDDQWGKPEVAKLASRSDIKWDELVNNFS